MAVMVVTLASAVGCASDPSAPTPGGDPNGQIMQVLRQATTAMPSDATTLFFHADEPRWESCGGRAGTYGWTDVVVDVGFTSSASDRSIAEHAAHTLDAQHWSIAYQRFGSPGDSFGWDKRLSSGSTATIQFSSPDRVSWTLLGDAPPSGRRISGC